MIANDASNQGKSVMVGTPEWLLEIIRCPVTGEPLKKANADQLSKIASRHASGDLCNRLGHSISTPQEDGLVNLSGSLFFPIRNGIATLVADEAIELEES